jgi:hypothetical protein
MSELLRSIVEIQAPFNMVIFVVLIGSIAGVIGTIATQVRKFASHRADIQLKREMVERGLTAEEIERIVAAKSPVASQAADD